jgi:hypothetical protein
MPLILFFFVNSVLKSNIPNKLLEARCTFLGGGRGFRGCSLHGEEMHLKHVQRIQKCILFNKFPSIRRLCLKGQPPEISYYIVSNFFSQNLEFKPSSKTTCNSHRQERGEWPLNPYLYFFVLFFCLMTICTSNTKKTLIPQNMHLLYIDKRLVFKTSEIP